MDYANLAKSAKRLIDSNGTKCILIHPGKQVYDPATNEYIDSGQRFDGVCIISGYHDRLVDGTVIQAGDRKITAVLSEEPKPGLSKLEVYDKAGTLKETYNVINANPVNPNASTVIVYKLQCRK